MTLDIITSPDLAPLRHGFFARRGGASSGVFEGLNCGRGSSDQTEMVEINRSRVANEMGVSPDRLITLYQVHSADVIEVGPDGLAPGTKADALVTRATGVALGTLSADCQPVLFAEPGAGIVGAAHAGWKGALAGVLEATIDAMVSLGAERERIAAVIGPTISQRAYEVGPEFLDTFLAADPDHARFFANGRNGRYQFDLPGFGLMRLRASGIGSAQWTGHCTYSDPERFFSYRRSVHAGHADYGRMIAAIRL